MKKRKKSTDSPREWSSCCFVTSGLAKTIRKKRKLLQIGFEVQNFPNFAANQTFEVMKKHLLFLLLAFAGMTWAQNTPMHGWHTYCTSELADVISYGTHTTVAVCYPPNMASNFAGTQITKVAMFSDGPTNSIGGIYTCSIYLGGETPSEGSIVYTMSCDVPQGLNDWAEFDLSTPIWVTGNETIWIVWQAEQPLSPWHMGVCGDIDPSGNGIWAWNGTQWDQIWFSTGDWMVKTYFNWDGPLPQDQDVYFAGNGDGIGKIWKNNALVYSISDSSAILINDMKVVNDSTIYSAGYNYSDFRGHMWMNDSSIFTTDDANFIERIIVDANGWTAAGGNTVWQNGETLYEYTIDSTTCNLYALAIDTVTGDIYAGGSIVTPGVYACVWKNDTIFWQCAGWSEVNDLCFDGENLYAAGFVYGAESIDGVVWQNDSIVFQIEGGEINAITEFNGSLYWAGISASDNTAYIWQDGEVLYAHPDCDGFNTLFVNEYGVYYAGLDDDVATLWKDGEILYQPEDCEYITAIAVLPTEVPQPQVEPLALPWFDGFEVDSTWTDWTILDFDGNTVIAWERTDEDAATGDFSARHLACDNIQEGWLISPPLHLNLYCDSTWMSFKTMEVNPSNYTSSSLLISTTGTQLSDFTEIWSQDNPSSTWDSIHIDLSAYQGNTIYLAFKYTGHHGHDWYIDDINVEEALTLYDITVESSNPDWGTVTGSGSYPHGETVQIEALPNIGREFLCWDDGIASNPRDIVVLQDSTFVALFAISQYTIEVVSDNPMMGTVTGGGTYQYGDTIVIAATPYIGFEFVSWTDGNTDNPRTIIVTENATYTAHFSLLQCVIKTEVTPEGAGTVDGGGTYDYGSTVQLIVHNNTGYRFQMWDDGNITNPRTIFVEGDAIYIAVFEPLPYEITTECDPVEGGTVSGAGTYYYGTTATLTATPNENYSFLCWSDGIASNPRTVTVTGNANYKALFHLNSTPQYTITVTSNNPMWGTVTGSGIYPQGSIAEISAIPNEESVFTGWDDGNTDNPRSIVVTQNMEFMAIFTKIETYTITVRPENPLLGTTYGSGEYTLNQIVNIGATPTTGYNFSGWQDGNMDNPRTIIVTGDAEYIASFSQEPVLTYTITVLCDETQGFILGAGTYIAGSLATIAAIPADGFVFVRWSDGTTDNPKEVIVDQDIVLAAFFEFTSVDENGTETVSLYPNPAADKLYLEGLEEGCEISIFNALGMKVKTTTLQGDSEINISDLPSGLYLVRMGNRHTLKFIKK